MKLIDIDTMHHVFTSHTANDMKNVDEDYSKEELLAACMEARVELDRFLEDYLEPLMKEAEKARKVSYDVDEANYIKGYNAALDSMGRLIRYNRSNEWIRLV